MAARLLFQAQLIDPRLLIVQSKLSFAFFNAKPVLPGHVTVAPLRQVPRFSALKKDELMDMWHHAHTLAPLLEKQFGASALTLHIIGASSHCAIQMVPRHAGDLAENDEIYRLLENDGGTAWKDAKEWCEHASVLRKAIE